MNSDDYVASIITWAGGYELGLQQYHLCDGTLQPIEKYNAYFSLVGSTYGGDGRVTVGIPDLRCRSAIAYGHGEDLSNHTLGEMGGAQQNNVTLTEAQMPVHNHTAEFDSKKLTMSTTVDTSTSQVSASLKCNQSGSDTTNPTGAYPATGPLATWAGSTDATMAANMVVNCVVTELNAQTVAVNANILVTIAASGSGEPYSVPTSLPVMSTNYYVALDGPYPPRP